MPEVKPNLVAWSSVRFDADPDPTFHFDADLDHDRNRILPKVFVLSSSAASVLILNIGQ